MSENYKAVFSTLLDRVLIDVYFIYIQHIVGDIKITQYVVVEVMCVAKANKNDVCVGSVFRL